MPRSPLLLASTLCPLDDTLQDEVLLAERAPADYVTRYAERLRGRGIVKPVPNLVEVALMEGLASRGLLAEVDPREDPERVIAKINRILAARSLPALNEAPLRPVFHEATADFVAAIGNQLASRRLTLMQFDTRAKRLSLLIAPAESVSTWIAAAKDTAVSPVIRFTN